MTAAMPAPGDGPVFQLRAMRSSASAPIPNISSVQTKWPHSAWF